jgi:hypothetical protein
LTEQTATESETAPEIEVTPEMIEAVLTFSEACREELEMTLELWDRRFEGPLDCYVA